MLYVLQTIANHANYNFLLTQSVQSVFKIRNLCIYSQHVWRFVTHISLTLSPWLVAKDFLYYNNIGIYVNSEAWKGTSLQFAFLKAHGMHLPIQHGWGLGYKVNLLIYSSQCLRYIYCKCVRQILCFGYIQIRHHLIRYLILMNRIKFWETTIETRNRIKLQIELNLKKESKG